MNLDVFLCLYFLQTASTGDGSEWLELPNMALRPTLRHGPGSLDEVDVGSRQAFLAQLGMFPNPFLASGERDSGNASLSDSRAPLLGDYLIKPRCRILCSARARRDLDHQSLFLIAHAGRPNSAVSRLFIVTGIRARHVDCLDIRDTCLHRLVPCRFPRRSFRATSTLTPPKLNTTQGTG